MDEIRLSSAQVPDQVEKVVRTLKKGREEDVKDVLPIELEKIGRKATKCLHLAQAVEARFEHVMDLTGELLEVSSSAKGYYQKSQEELKLKRDMALQKEKSTHDKLALAKEQKEKIEKEVKEAKAGWEKAADSMPSGWHLVKMQFVETLTNTISNCAAFVLPMMAIKGVAGGKVTALLATASNQEMQPGTEQAPTVVQTMPPSFARNADQLKILIGKLVEILESASKKSSKEPKDGDELAAAQLRMTRLSLEELQKCWPSEVASPHDEEALNLLERSLGICTEGETMMDQLNLPPDEIKAIFKQASKLKSEVMKFCTKAHVKTGGNPIYIQPPRQSGSMASSANSASSSAAQSAVESARFKIAEARGLLERQQNRYDQTCNDLKESNEQLSKVLQSLAEFSPEKIANFDQTRETLTKGIKALASVREQWQKMVEFFQFITNIITVCQKESLASFVEYAKVGQRRVLANGYAGTDFMRDLIYEQVSQANRASFVVWSISNTYVEISRNHLTSRLASLGHLMALDPEKERQTIEAKRYELIEGSREAQEAIRKYVSEARDHFHEKVTKRIKQIETELVKALPAEDPAKIKEINDSVKNAIKEADEELGEDKF